MVRDCQTNERFEFICNKWLAQEKGDEQIERLLPVSGEAQKRVFKHLFERHTERGLKEHHLWFSIFMRSKRSRFTRVQRVGTCYALLFLSMLANALWYQLSDEQVNPSLKIGGKFIFSLEQIVIGLLANAITLIPALLMIFCFRLARRRKLRRNRINLAIENEGEQWKQEEHVSSDDEVGFSANNSAKESISSKSSRISNSEDVRPGSMIRTARTGTDEHDDTISVHRVQRVKDRKKFTLPWPFMLVGWYICIASIVVALYFLWAYAILWGNDKTYQWLSSMLISFFAGMVFLEPLKVMVVTMLVSCCCHCGSIGDLDDDDVDEDEEKVRVFEESKWHRKRKERQRGYTGFYPIDEEYLEVLRRKRYMEVEMWAVVKELIGYAFFILIIYLISYGNRHPMSYKLQQQMQRNFIVKNGFDQIVTSNDWWEWCHNTMVNELRAQNYYNGVPPYGLRGFIGDKVNRIMGYAVIRQIRVKPNTCRVDRRVHNITQECAQASNQKNEDTKDYCNAWEEQTALTENLPSCVKTEFKYTTAKELQGIAYSADVDRYNGGGYVYRLNGGSKQVRQELKDLQQQHWVNNHTRALFLEFSTYNANLNLFVIATLVAEFIPGGGILPYSRFEIVRLLHHHEKSGTLLQIAEIIYVLFILSFIFQQLAMMKKLRKKYWKSYWPIAEWSVIILSFVAFFLYGWRLILTKDILQTFQETYGNGYMKLQFVGVIDEYFGYLVGLILFTATINFIKLLRFNNRFNVLLKTLKACWEDLSGFMAVFALVFVAFVQVFYMILHNDLLEFHTVVATLETCFTMLLNKFKFGSIRETSLTAAAMFFFFAISCSFILINVLLTIIIEAFEQVKEELAEQGNKYEIITFIRRQTALHIGTQKLPHKDSALKKDHDGDSDNEMEYSSGDVSCDENADNDKDDGNTIELPHKIDEFVNYINNAYFNGELQFKVN